MLQYVVIDQIHFNTSQRGAHIRGEGGLITWCIFLFTGGWAYNWGAYKEGLISGEVEGGGGLRNTYGNGSLLLFEKMFC